MLPLAPWSRLSSSVGSEGFEPSPHRLKGEYAAVTPRPRRESGVTFQTLDWIHENLSSVPGVGALCSTNFRSLRRLRKFCHSGPGGARILVSGFSDRRYTVSATDPMKKAGRFG